MGKEMQSFRGFEQQWLASLEAIYAFTASAARVQALGSARARS